MKAIVYDHYGSPDVLRLEQVDQPQVADGEVLVRVRAAALNSWDWDLLTGRPLAFRFYNGLRRKYRILGADVAGHVEAVGRHVTRFRPGDEVFGDLSQCGWGGYAEWVSADESALTHKPAGMSFEQAAALPQAGAMALQGLRDEGRIQAGQRVLINGAGGGVGTFAIQLAKAFGAEVTGVDRTEKLEALPALGADHVIDFTREDFAAQGPRYDLILDVTAQRSLFDYARAMTPGASYVMLGGRTRYIYQMLLLGRWISWKTNQRMRLLLAEPNHDLAYLLELFEAGKLRPVIDRCYALDEVPEAFRQFGAGRFVGKIVIQL